MKKRIKNMFAQSRDRHNVNRIEWCDIYKGLVILYVVIGHTTSIYNPIIYQFHMAAFFFMSGFVMKKDGRLFDNIIKKFYQLLVPYYLINLAGVLLFFVFDKVGILSYVSTTEYNVGLGQAISLLLEMKVVYCDWLGAMWFLPVLFCGTIIVLCLLRICNSKLLLLALSIIIFACVETVYSNSMIALGGRAQFFIMVGYIVKNFYLSVEERLQQFYKKKYYFFYLLICLCAVFGIWRLCYNFGLNKTVDWPSYSFNGNIDMILPWGGIISTIILAIIIDRIKYVRSIFNFIGRNTMGIMCFHFAAFKVAYLLLVLFRKMRFDEVHLLTPPANMGVMETLLIVIIAIGLSIAIWKVLNLSRGISLALGAQWKDVYCVISKIPIYNGLLSAGELLGNIVDNIICVWRAFVQKHRRLCIIGCLAIIALIPAKDYILYSGQKMVTFPYYGNNVQFSDGWLPQGADEKYRWIDKDAKFSAYITNERKLTGEGYIPENITAGSYLRVKVNGQEVFYTEACANMAVEIEADISPYIKKYSMNEFEIETDITRIPNNSDADQRIFSMLINYIEIK